MDISSRQIIIFEHVIFGETRIYDAQKKISNIEAHDGTFANENDLTFDPNFIKLVTIPTPKLTPTHNLRTPIPRFQDQIEPSTQPTSSTSPILIMNNANVQEFSKLSKMNLFWFSNICYRVY
jgi:hypothetical protein